MIIMQSVPAWTLRLESVSSEKEVEDAWNIDIISVDTLLNMYISQEGDKNLLGHLEVYCVQDIPYADGEYVDISYILSHLDKARAQRDEIRKLIAFGQTALENANDEL